MELIKLTDFLQKVALFKNLALEELEAVARSVRIKKHKAGEYLFTERDKQSDVYMVYDGDVELFMRNTLGIEKRLAIFGRFDFLGEGTLIDNTYHSTNARTLSRSTVLTISRDFFGDHGHLMLKVFANIAVVMSHRIRNANTYSIQGSQMYFSGHTRVEHDLLGDREVPVEYYYGVQTLRAVENFNISGVTISFFPHLIEGLAIVKMAAARANEELGLLPKPIADAIVRACNELINGRHHSHFVVDMIQGGAGTSTNMNINEVLANRALEILGHEKGQYEYCHPNNHVNLAQSTNDAYPSAVKLALIFSTKELIEVLKDLIAAFAAKGKEFARVIKMGRTQLQDAVPMTLGQEFEAYAVTLGEEITRLEQNAKLFLELNMGGTAIGTGICADPDYSSIVIKHLREITGLDVVLASNLVEATQDTGAFVMYSSAVKRLAVKLSKICNDLRLLSSGPRAGLHEINLPPMQPGSTIMPGKVNPVIPEVVNQIAFRVIGGDLTVTIAAEAGQLELNVMEPIIVYSLFQNINMLKNGMDTLNNRCIKGITANAKVCRDMVERSIGLVTALNPYIGYENCTNLAQKALETGRSVYELVLEDKLLSKEKLDSLLTPENMIRPCKF